MSSTFPFLPFHIHTNHPASAEDLASSPSRDRQRVLEVKVEAPKARCERGACSRVLEGKEGDVLVGVGVESVEVVSRLKAFL